MRMIPGVEDLEGRRPLSGDLPGAGEMPEIPIEHYINPYPYPSVVEPSMDPAPAYPSEEWIVEVLLAPLTATEELPPPSPTLFYD